MVFEPVKGSCPARFANGAQSGDLATVEGNIFPSSKFEFDGSWGNYRSVVSMTSRATISERMPSLGSSVDFWLKTWEQTLELLRVLAITQCRSLPRLSWVAP